MKVLVISNMYPSKEDVTYGTFVYNFMAGLKRHESNHRIHKILIKGRSKSKIKKLLKYISFYSKMILYLSFCNYDIIYVHTITYPTIVLSLVNKIKKLTIVFNIHGIDLLPSKTLTKRLKQLCYPLILNCKALVVPSNYYKRLALESFPGLNEDKVIISPSGGIDKTFFCHKLRRLNSVPCIGFISRIDEAKGWRTFLSALEILKSNKYEFKAIIGGKGNDSALIAEIQNKGLKECTTYIGPVSHSDMPTIYKTFDVFIFPSESDSESLGLVGLEAMANSIPVIGSDIGGIKTYLIDSYNGYIFHRKNPKDLANKIIKLLSLSENDLNYIQENAYNTAIPYESDRVLTSLFQKIFN